MKKLLLLLGLMAGLFLTTIPARAAFVCRPGNVPANNVTDSAGQYVSYNVAPASYHDGWYGPRRHFNGEAHRAIRWAMWGLFFWPLGIFAIAHGIRGLRHRGSDNDLAVLAIIIGSLEVLATIWFVLVFFWWWSFFPGFYMY